MVFSNSKKRYDLTFPIILTVLSLLFGFLLGLVDGIIVFDEINAITVASVLLFIAVTIFSNNSDQCFSLALPFVFVAFPTAVNNIFPGVYLENAESEVIYPIVCHTEIFLLFSLFAGKGRIDTKTGGLIFLLTLSFLLTSIFIIVTCYSSHYILLLVAGQYPVRLLMLLAIVVKRRHIYIKKLLMGFCIAILFLALESTVNTFRLSFSTWTSGSLGSNTLGNVLGIMVVSLVYYVIMSKVHSQRKLVLLFSSLIGVVVVILTDTRMALLAMLIVTLVIIYPVMSKKVKIISILLVLLVVGYVVKNNVVSQLGGKMDFNAAMDAIDYSKSAGLEIRYTEATTSLMTRMKLWETSLKMFADKPLTGIGWNLFNVLKYKYGFDIDVIIDPHNGYLSFLSQLGIWAFFWLYFLYYKSWKLFYKSKNVSLKTIALFNAGMSICELTNAGSYKYSVLSMLLFVSVYINMMYKTEMVANTSKC